MKTLSKTLIAAAAFAAIATTAFSQAPWEFKSGHGPCYVGRKNVGDGHGAERRRTTRR